MDAEAIKSQAVLLSSKRRMTPTDSPEVKQTVMEKLVCVEPAGSHPDLRNVGERGKAEMAGDLQSKQGAAMSMADSESIVSGASMKKGLR